MITPGTVTLIGLMGAGKTRVGERVAACLQRPFYDTDALVAAAAGRPIAEIFADDGEEAFRALETEAIRRAVDRPGAVLAVGGGAVLRRDNVTLLRSAGEVLWLCARPETLAARLRHSPELGDRPLLAGVDVRQRLQELLEERGEAYASAATAVLQTDGLGVQQTADLVIAWLGERVRAQHRAP